MALCAAHVTMACACQAQTMCCAQLSGHWWYCWYCWCAEQQSNNLWKAHHTMGKQEAVGQHVWLPQATPCLASCWALMATFAPTDPCSQPLSRFVACCCCSHRHGTSATHRLPLQSLAIALLVLHQTQVCRTSSQLCAQQVSLAHLRAALCAPAPLACHLALARASRPLVAARETYLLAGQSLGCQSDAPAK